MVLANVYTAERFGKWPWELEGVVGMPADRVMFYRNVMAAEAEVQGLLEGLPRDESLHWEEDD